MKLVWKILIGIVTFIAIIVGTVFYSAGGTKDAAEAIIVNFHAGNIEAVYNNSSMTDEFTYDEFYTVMGIGTELDISTAEKISWNGMGFENNEKYVYGNFKFSDGSEQVITYWFEEIDDELKLLGITGGTPDEYEE